MKKSLLALAALAVIGGATAVRAKTNDVAFAYRMGAGFPGDVNRTHPFSILPGLINTSVQSPRLYGDPVLVDSATSSYRGLTVSDTGLAAPVQANTATSTTGGTLAAATYFYVVTAINAAGQETNASNEKSQTTTGATSSNTITWAAVPGATAYKVYRGTASGLENGYYLLGNVLTYLDTNAAFTGVGSAPQVNQGAGVNIAGALVRPFPVQQSSGGMSSALGAATPPTSGVADILREGYMIAKCNNFGANAPTLGGAVHIWTAASSGNHVQGGFEAAATAGSTVQVLNAKWRGGADSAGIAEIEIVVG